MAETDRPPAGNEKERLEIEKLKAEIAELETPPWRKPAYLAVFLPVGLAVMTLVTGWVTGYFNTERMRLNNEKIRLENETNNLRTAGKDIVARMQTVNSSLQKITGSKDLKLQDLDKKLRAQHPNSTQLHETVRLIRTDVSEIDKELNANQSELAKLKEAFAMPGEK